LGIFCAVP